ncbi:G-protein coupled receptor GRL101-like [Littorina saxatilis]|uniref:G-protein coupled receptor GRL101-like n=1 Tax=Littorina saxatilis TaxID=31220 RepID=UPI0038B5542D
MGCLDRQGRYGWSPYDLSFPAVIDVNKTNGLFSFWNMKEGADGVKVCPETHVRCPNNGNCLPVYLRCNGVFDCVHHEDEAACDNITCPGFYRCRGSTVCLHPNSVCDDVPQCPLHDDEMCDMSCPPNCVCRGLAFYCAERFPMWDFEGLRYLDASGSGLIPSDVKGTHLLVFLRLAQCGLTRLEGLALPNLLYLDVSYNNLSSLNAAQFQGVPQVRRVVLSGNVFLRLLDSGQRRHDRLAELDLSDIHVPRLNATVLTAFPGLQQLNLSGSRIQQVLDDGFQRLTELSVVDLRGCPVSHIPPVMFQGLRSLQAVYADSFRLCCPALLPADFNVHKCAAPFDDVSTCDDLLGSEAYSAATFVIALVAVIGNGSSFVFRMFVSKSKSKLGFGVFVTHLSLSDFLMGVYLVVLGVADRVYKGRYLWNDMWWRNSSACKVAGFLSLLSSEVSTLIMCLITLDRFLVLRFPFSRKHFGLTSAHVASGVAWLAGVILATVPLLPVTSHWQFYGHTSICLPLPVTRKDFSGREYSFGIVIVLNFVLFLFVCCGQLVIYGSVQANAMTAAATSTTRKTQDLTIARRLLAVAMSDFLCWFPIGLLGLLASRGVPVPGEVNVAMAVFVLPLNSALNPFLYTVNVLLERRRLAREDRLRKLILSQLNAKR